MAKARSHILSEVHGSLGGLTYQTAQGSAISLRTRAGAHRRTTNAGELHDQRLRFCGERWRRLPESIRLDWDQYARLHVSALSGVKQEGGNRGKQAFITAMMLARACGIYTGNPTDDQCRPNLQDPPPFFYSIVFTTPAAGHIRATLNKGFAANAAARMLIVGPYARTTNARPRGYPVARAVTVTASGGIAPVLNITGLRSGLVYFVRVQSVFYSVGLHIGAGFDQRMITT